MSKNYMAAHRASQTPQLPVRKFEMGGAAPGPMGGAPAPAPEAGAGDPMAALSQMVAQFAQTQDPQLALQIAQALVQVMGAGAPAPEAAAAPAGGAPMAANGMKLRVFQKGGKAPVK